MSRMTSSRAPKVKADLEWELGRLVLDCTVYDMEVHWGQGVGMADPGHWAPLPGAARRTGRSRQCGPKLPSRTRPARLSSG
jgi:hypothetical protein